MRHFVTKSTGLKAAKAGMSIHFSESGDPIYVGSALCPECRRKDWHSKSCWHVSRMLAIPTGRVVYGTYLSVPFQSHPIAIYGCPIPRAVSHGIPTGITFPLESDPEVV